MSNIAGMIRQCAATVARAARRGRHGHRPRGRLGARRRHRRSFPSKGAHVIASTHYRGLKMYAANDEGVVNASVEIRRKDAAANISDCSSASPVRRPASRSHGALASTKTWIDAAREKPRTSRLQDSAKTTCSNCKPKLTIRPTDLRISSRRGTRGRRDEIRRSRGRGPSKKKRLRQKEFEGQLATAD